MTFSFAPSIYKSFLGHQLHESDLQRDDNRLYKSITSLLTLSSGELDLLDLYFNVTCEDMRVIELIPIGNQIKVDMEIEISDMNSDLLEEFFQNVHLSIDPADDGYRINIDLPSDKKYRSFFKRLLTGKDSFFDIIASRPLQIGADFETALYVRFLRLSAKVYLPWKN